MKKEELIAMSEHDEFQSLKEGGGSTDEILRAMKDRGLTIIHGAGIRSRYRAAVLPWNRPVWT